MSKSIKPKNNTYIDSSGVSHDRLLLSDILNTKIIYESGSNNNGRYVKFSDGTMICWGERTFYNVDITTSWGSVYETPSKLDFGTFPVPFISRPSITMTPHYGVTCYLEILDGLSATNLGKTWLMCPVQRSNVSISFNYMAIGKWK